MSTLGNPITPAKSSPDIVSCASGYAAAASICSRFQGKVFEIPAGAALEPGQFLLSERQGERGPILRLLCDAPPADGVPVSPGLEDAFLAIYREGAA